MKDFKIKVWDESIPKNLIEVEEGSTGQWVEWDYVKNSDYLRDALNGEYPFVEYIGITDVNGKEIYSESDIIKVKIDDVWHEGVVKWEKTSYVLEGYGYLSRVLNKGCDLEIIGNTYETKS